MNIKSSFSFDSITKPEHFNSDYIPSITFKNQRERELANAYVSREVERFFKFIEPEKILEISYFSYSISITPRDFISADIEYFYNKIFYDLGERDQQGKLIIKPKWCITFDIECAPIEIPRLQIVPYPSYRRFGTIDIRGNPVLYYIYFTLQEILDHIKNSD